MGIYEPEARLEQGDNGALCPRCGFECWHITAVEIGARKEDDLPISLVKVDAYTGVTTTEPTAYEVSLRRQWVTLVVDCENCGSLKLAFAQHKGATHVFLLEEN